MEFFHSSSLSLQKISCFPTIRSATGPDHVPLRLGRAPQRGTFLVAAPHRQHGRGLRPRETGGSRHQAPWEGWVVALGECHGVSKCLIRSGEFGIGDTDVWVSSLTIYVLMYIDS